VAYSTFTLGGTIGIYHEKTDLSDSDFKIENVELAFILIVP
jgi:hypothetical protein